MQSEFRRKPETDADVGVPRFFILTSERWRSIHGYAAPLTANRRYEKNFVSPAKARSTSLTEQRREYTNITKQWLRKSFGEKKHIIQLQTSLRGKQQDYNCTNQEP